MNAFLAILLIIFVAAVGYYVIHSSTAQVDFFKNFPLLHLASSTSNSGTSTGFLPYTYTLPGSGPTATATPSSGTGSTVSAIRPEDIPYGFTAKQLSPYFKKVRIAEVSSHLQGTVGAQSVVLRAQLEDKSGVNISTWTLKANRGGQVIPQGARVLHTTLSNQQNDIVLKNNESLKLFSTAGPLKLTFRLNKCVGYLANQMLFTPALPRECPTPPRTDVFTFTGACQDYILSLNNCRLPASNPPVPSDDYACRKYLTTLNYEGCVDRYKNDADFLGSEWWSWTGRQFLDEAHDRVLLYDRKGLLVDQYVY